MDQIPAYLVYKPDGNVYYVVILPHKDKSVYRFVNLTKGHICSCEFKSIEDAIKDMNDRIARGLIVKYESVNYDINRRN